MDRETVWFRTVVIIVIFGFVTALAILIPGDNQDVVSSAKLRECLELQVKYRRAGNLELTYIMYNSLRDDKFTIGEYSYFKKRLEEVTNRCYVQAFKNDTFQFIEQDGININLPEGYIERKAK